MQLTRRLSADWDMTFGQGLSNFARDAEATAQNVKANLQLLQGEWFLDVSAGVPYLRNDYVTRAIIDKPTDLAFVESVVKQTILNTDGVDHIDDFKMTFDTRTRRLSVSVTVFTVYDDITTIQVRI